MRNEDLLEICYQGIEHLDVRKQEFIKKLKTDKKFKKVLALTPMQYQYLVSCYDKVISIAYDVEPLVSDSEFAAKRAIAKNQKLGK